MSRIDELIQQYCPNGVEYKRIVDICNVLRGKRLTKKELKTSGKFPVYHGGIEPIGFFDVNNRDANTVMIINVGASAGTVNFSYKDFWSSDGCFCMSKTSEILPRFLYFILKRSESDLKGKV